MYIVIRDDAMMNQPLVPVIASSDFDNFPNPLSVDSGPYGRISKTSGMQEVRPITLVLLETDLEVPAHVYQVQG
jgi:hypothetical protein